MSDQLVKKRGPSNYTDQEIELGLRTMAMCSGNSRKAAEACDIPYRTLYGWATEHHRDRYARIREDLLPQLEADVAEGTDRVARRLTEVEEKAADLVLEKLSVVDTALDPIQRAAQLAKLNLKELSGVGRDASVGKGINLQRGLELRGRPTSIIEHRSSEEVLRKLVATGGVVLEGTAEEVTPELPAPTPSRSTSRDADSHSQTHDA